MTIKIKYKMDFATKQVLEELENEVFHLERNFRDAMEVIQSRITWIKEKAIK